MSDQDLLCLLLSIEKDLCFDHILVAVILEEKYWNLQFTEIFLWTDIWNKYPEIFSDVTVMNS